MRVRPALVAIEGIGRALETSHVASLLLCGLLDRVHRQLALFAVDNGFVLATSVDGRELVSLFVLGWLTVVVAEGAHDVDVHELGALIAIICQPLEEGSRFALLLDVDEDLGVVARRSISVRRGHVHLAAQLLEHCGGNEMLVRFYRLVGCLLGQEIDECLELIVRLEDNEVLFLKDLKHAEDAVKDVDLQELLCDGFFWLVAHNTILGCHARKKLRNNLRVHVDRACFREPLILFLDQVERLLSLNALSDVNIGNHDYIHQAVGLLVLCLLVALVDDKSDDLGVAHLHHRQSCVVNVLLVRLSESKADKLIATLDV